MAIGGYRTATEVSKPVRRKSGGAGAGMLNFGGSIPRLTGAGEGFQAMARMGADVQRFGGSLRRSAEEQADKDAAAAAQKLQAELGETAQQLYQRQGTSADGITDEWTKAANERVRDVGAGLDSMTRERLKERMAPWLAGRRENLMGHQAREVRRGRIMEFENDMTATAASETNDILAQVRGEEQGWDDEKTSAAGLGAEAAAGADERIAKERKAVAQGHLTQLGLVAASHEERFDQAVKDGLFSPEEAAARKRAYRGNTVRTAIGALIADGRADSAEAMLDELEGNKEMLSEQCGLDAKELARFRQQVDGIRRRRAAEAEAAREKAEREQLEQISLASREARADGSLGALEGAAKNMSAEAMRFPTGDRRRVAAMEEAKRLDAAADAEAKRLAWDGILDHAGDKEEWKPPKGSRMAKFHKALKESFDRQAAAYAAEGMLAEASAVQEERKANVATLRASMMQAAAIDPGGFSARLAEAAEKGHITLDQYRKLRDDFNDVWMQKGMPQKGAALVQILKNEFYADADYDLNDRLAVNPKTGRFEYGKNPETKKPFDGEEVEFESTETVPAESHSGILWNIAPGTAWVTSKPRTRKVTHTLTSDEQLKMLDWAMELAKHDGEWISTDPQTGVRLDKPRKLDAAAEFQDACSRMRTMKRAQSSQDLVVERANAMLNLRAGFAQADDAVTGAAAKREAAELKTREALKTAKRKPFTPKMPGGARGGNSASEGEED